MLARAVKASVSLVHLVFLCACAFSLSACGVARTECSISADCGYGQRCSAGSCVANDKADCRLDDECPTGQYCTRNGCVPDPNCLSSTDCPDGYACDRHACIKERCTVDAECSGGRCVGDRCVDCVQDSECGGGRRCIDWSCVLPECVSDNDCGAGQTCVEYACEATLVSGQLWTVAEEGEAVLSLPASVTITDPGSSSLGSLSAVEGGLHVQATSCAEGSQEIRTTLKLADGELKTLISTLRVVDSTAPESTALSLSDRPREDVVNLEFQIPAENTGGSCPTRSFELAWRGSARESWRADTLDLSNASVGELVRHTLPVAFGDQLEVVLRAIDDSGKQTESKATLALVRPELRAFSLSETAAVPGQDVELSYEVVRASRVELLRDGVVVATSTQATASWMVRAAPHSSEFSLRVFDENGGHLYAPGLELSPLATPEAEPNQDSSRANPALGWVVGDLQAGDPDVFAIELVDEGGYFEVRTEDEHASCETSVRLELFNPAGERIVVKNGACPSIGPGDVFNLPRGVYHLRVTTSGEDMDYALFMHPRGPSCGNGFVETRVHEACDGGAYCDQNCEPTIRLTSAVQAYPAQEEVSGVDFLRVKITMTERGWIDVSPGHLRYAGCPSGYEVVLEDGQLNPLRSFQEGLENDCSRALVELQAGEYYVLVRNNNTSSDGFHLNYAAHLWGRCGDAVVNPLAGEQCDVDADTCDASCQVVSGEIPAPLEINGGTFCMEDNTYSNVQIFCRTEEVNEDFPTRVLVEMFFTDTGYITHGEIECNAREEVGASFVPFLGNSNDYAPRVWCFTDERPVAIPSGPIGEAPIIEIVSIAILCKYRQHLWVNLPGPSSLHLQVYGHVDVLGRRAGARGELQRQLCQGILRLRPLDQRLADEGEPLAGLEQPDADPSADLEEDLGAQVEQLALGGGVADALQLLLGVELEAQLGDQGLVEVALLRCPVGGGEIIGGDEQGGGHVDGRAGVSGRAGVLGPVDVPGRAVDVDIQRGLLRIGRRADVDRAHADAGGPPGRVNGGRDLEGGARHR